MALQKRKEGVGVGEKGRRGFKGREGSVICGSGVSRRRNFSGAQKKSLCEAGWGSPSVPPSHREEGKAPHRPVSRILAVSPLHKKTKVCRGGGKRWTFSQEEKDKSAILGMSE